MRSGIWIVVVAVLALGAWFYSFPEWMLVGIHFGR
jgi:hypothetical protein